MDLSLFMELIAENIIAGQLHILNRELIKKNRGNANLNTNVW